MIIVAYLTAIIAVGVYLLSKFDSPVRYLVVLPIFVSIFFIPVGKTSVAQFLKFTVLFGLVYYIYCTIVLILVDGSSPVSTSWGYALILTIWAALLRLINTIRTRGAASWCVSSKLGWCLGTSMRCPRLRSTNPIGRIRDDIYQSYHNLAWSNFRILVGV